MPTRLQLKPVQSRSDPELGKKIVLFACLTFFYIEWVLDVIRRQTEHLFLRLEAQHGREC